MFRLSQIAYKQVRDKPQFWIYCFHLDYKTQNPERLSNFNYELQASDLVHPSARCYVISTHPFRVRPKKSTWALAFLLF